MKAIGYNASLPISDAESLLDLDIPAPVPGPRDLLVRVKAISVNPVDVKVRASRQPKPGVPEVLGYDAAGVVEAVGAEVTLFQPGDEVFYAGVINRPGTNAELHAVDERIVGRKPKTLSFAEAAALPLTAITAWELLFDRLKVAKGQQGGSLLVINGAGGVGSILIQIARQLTGLKVIATASRPETVAWVEKMGAHLVVDHRKPLNEALRAAGVEQVDYVASLTATDKHLPAIVDIIAPQGSMALIDDPMSLDIVALKRKAVTVAWELMFTRPLFNTPDMIEQHRLLNEVAGLVEAGTLKTTLTRVVGPIDAAHLREAHAALESGSTIGKLVLGG
ncbi:zinc-binding alcohol dehydrogenase family protein [Acetobacteraceae bacterium H6797]|nr:zinc-binding alcohol dehydrogenase family protein [Acetobacteraceae bacterium H6797]